MAKKLGVPLEEGVSTSRDARLSNTRRKVADLAGSGDVKRLRAECEAVIQQQRRMMEIAGAIAGHDDPDAVFRMVRDAILETGAVDRAAVWIVEGDLAKGTWGTDEFGKPRDEHQSSFPLHGFGLQRATRLLAEDSFMIHETRSVKLRSGETVSSVPYVVMPIRASGGLVGILTLDTLLTMRKITSEGLGLIAPLAKQAAIAVLNSRLRCEHEAVIKQQQRVMDLTLAITSNEDPDNVFLMVRNAIMDMGFFDRVSVWVAEGRSFQGTWGTDESGELKDEHDLSFPIDCMTTGAAPIGKDHAPFVIDSVTFETSAGEALSDVPRAVIPLRVGGEFIGFISVDTLLSRCKITDRMVSDVLPIADQAAVAIQKARLLKQRETMVQQQRQVMEIAAAISENEDPDTVLKMVRDAILDIGCADRAGVWLVEDMVTHGTWGTDEQGRPMDEHGMSHSIARFAAEHPKFMVGDTSFVIVPAHTFTMSNGEVREDIPYAVIRLGTGRELVGYVSIDTLLTSRAITPEVIDLILPLARQAAIAVINSRLRTEREEMIKHQRQLMDIAVAVTQNQDTDAVFKMVRDAIMRLGLVDRAGVWLIEGDTAWGTWGTDNRGRLTDEHGRNFSITSHLSDFGTALKSDAPFAIDFLHSDTLPSGEVRNNVPHALIPLRAGSQLVGVLAVDTLMTMRPITPEAVELMLPLAELAAVVVVKRRLHAEAREEIERRRDMETTLIEQTHELMAARDAALAGAKAKSEFLARMTHEIRTPMNGVIGLNSLLTATPLSPLQLEYAKGVQTSAELLLAVINAIFDFNDLESGTFKIENRPFKIQDCLQGVVEQKAGAVKGGVRLSLSIPEEFPEWLIGDDSRVRQIVANVVDNAIKFTAAGEIEVSAQCVLQSPGGATVRIEIRDTGVGIATDRQSAVFESFTQAEGGLTRRYDGAGLGLTTTRRIVELMGGKIRLDSIHGKGTTVRMDIPFKKPLPVSDSAQESSANPDAKLELRVLVAEDNPVNSIVLAGRLEGWGCTCVVVENGIEALRSISTQRFDIVLMDVSMPEMDGIQATQELRRMEQATGSHLPVMAITAHATDADREKCLEAGMDDYTSKPVDFSELHHKLQWWSGQNSAGGSNLNMRTY